MIISRDATDTDVMTIGRGTIDFGSGISSGLRRNTSNITIDFASNGRGGLDTGSLAANTYYYLWAVPDDDNSNNFEGVASTSASVTGLAITGERLVGWCYSTSTSVISLDAVGAYRKLGGDAPNVYSARQGGVSLTLGATSLISFHTAKYYSSGRPLRISYGASAISASGTQSLCASISVDSVAAPETEAFASLVQPYSNGCAGVYIVNPGEGTNDIELKLDSTHEGSTEAFTIKSWYLNIEEL